MNISTRARKLVAMAGLLAIVSTGCTYEEILYWNSVVVPATPGATPVPFEMAVVPEAAPTPPPTTAAPAEAANKYHKHNNVISDAGLARLRKCESGGNYQITNPSGKYRGAYQFGVPTWNGVAARHYPELNGVDPVAAAPEAQDAMARALWSERGRYPWPHCGTLV